MVISHVVLCANLIRAHTYTLKKNEMYAEVKIAYAIKASIFLFENELDCNFVFIIIVSIWLLNYSVVQDNDFQMLFKSVFVSLRRFKGYE